MFLDDTKISIAFVLAMAALVTVIVISLIGSVCGWMFSDPGERLFFVAPFIGLGLVWAALTAAFCFPYDMDYHQWRKVDGQVREITMRYMSNGNGGTDQQFVVTYEPAVAGRSLTARCDDSRCAEIRRGDRLTLWCVREWQWASQPGWGCRYGGMKR